MNLPEEIIAAENRIRPHIRETILEHSLFYSSMEGANVYFKMENLQHTGSFKVRGAMNKLLSLNSLDRARGLVAASTGNHGAAVAFSLNKLEAPCIVFVPENADPNKTEAIRRLGAEVRHYGQDAVDTEAHARRYAAANNLTYISPYNDLQIIAGQGTIAVELVRQLPQIDVVFAALGGGGLIAGIAGYLKSVQPGVKIIGCSPANSQVMIQSLKTGRIMDIPSLPTLSDGTAGGLEPGAMTFDLCRNLVDDCVAVTEDEIKISLIEFIRVQHMLVEGSAAVAIAAFRKQASQFAGKNVVVVICGANIGLETLKEVVDDSGS